MFLPKKSIAVILISTGFGVAVNFGAARFRSCFWAVEEGGGKSRAERVGEEKAGRAERIGRVSLRAEKAGKREDGVKNGVNVTSTAGAVIFQVAADRNCSNLTTSNISNTNIKTQADITNFNVIATPKIVPTVPLVPTVPPFPTTIGVPTIPIVPTDPITTRKREQQQTEQTESSESELIITSPAQSAQSAQPAQSAQQSAESQTSKKKQIDMRHVDNATHMVRNVYGETHVGRGWVICGRGNNPSGRRPEAAGRRGGEGRYPYWHQHGGRRLRVYARRHAAARRLRV